MKKVGTNTVFITRDLDKNSPFYSRLNHLGYKIHGESLVAFEAMPFQLDQSPEWIFFYSRHAVHYFFSQLKDQSKIARSRFACMGSGTAKYLKQHISSIDFIGNGEPEFVATDFKKLAQGQIVLFPQAKQSRRSIQLILGDEIQSSDLIVYNNQVRSEFTIPFCSILVFTSPLNIEAYTSKYLIMNDQQVMAIGKVTARRLIEKGLQNVLVAAEPTEEALADLVLKA